MNGALVLFEARRLARHPAPWAAAALALASVAVRSGAWLPDLTVVAIDTVTGSALVAAAVLVVAHLAASRDRRHGLPETLAAMPAREAARTRAVVLAAPAAGGLVTATMIFPYLLVVSASDTAAGRLDPYEALGGVALTMLAASAGAALGRWTPWPVAPPVAIFLVAFTVLGDPRGEYGGWFLPVISGHDVSWGGQAHRVASGLPARGDGVLCRRGPAAARPASRPRRGGAGRPARRGTGGSLGDGRGALGDGDGVACHPGGAGSGVRAARRRLLLRPPRLPAVDLHLGAGTAADRVGGAATGARADPGHPAGTGRWPGL
ncbi:hypothetical protein GCM10017559_39530 [Streptosporangium longisporum]|uniref:ABC transporter permease n=1 Tax=Streptosporangium longisporum TaxID=46187 RepID=A0ABP6KP75_9ACTN